jgi:hypothetical protein
MAEDEKKNLPEAKTKNSTGRLFLETFFTKDLGMVKDVILFERVAPAVKDFVADFSTDVVTSLINLIFYGEAGSRRHGYSNRSSIKTDYGTIYRTTQTGKFSPNERKSYEEPMYTTRSSRKYMDLIFESRVEAEDCLDQLREVLDQYKVVSIADYYDIYEQITETEVPAAAKKNWAQSQNFGWDDLSEVIVVGRRGEYYLTLPRASVIK